jgi:hypothetical protein
MARPLRPTLLALAIIGASMPMPLFAEETDDGIELRNELAQAQAQASCQSGDRAGFFDALLQSSEVLTLHARNSIQYVVFDRSDEVRREQIVESLNYASAPSLFPLTMLDYSRVTTPQASGKDAPVDVVVEFEKWRKGGFIVSWTMVEYGGAEMDEPFGLDGMPYDPDGRPDGELRFEATPNCWELVADYRWQDAQ